MPTVFDCSLLQLPRFHRRASEHAPVSSGNITPIYGGVHIPFEIARVYYLYDIPGGESRGGHAHKELQQLIIAASGSFDVLLDDGTNKRIVTLNRPYYGLLMPRMIWRELMNFSAGGICLVLASLNYDEHEYIRDYHEFLTAAALTNKQP
jgi:hypothetical protein